MMQSSNHRSNFNRGGTNAYSLTFHDVLLTTRNQCEVVQVLSATEIFKKEKWKGGGRSKNIYVNAGSISKNND
jgi:hypothetical protein